MATYNKSELLSKVAGEAGVSKADAEGVLNAFFGTVTEAAKSDGKVSWAGFGSFSASHRAARVGRNPRTGEPLQIKASTSVKFTAAKALKDELNG
ncbi:MAG: HU family DNA-binding protein [Acidimicrobiales bacterium]